MEIRHSDELKEYFSRYWALNAFDYYSQISWSARKNSGRYYSHAGGPHLSTAFFTVTALVKK